MATYEDALQSLTPEKWKALSVQEKLDTLQAVEDHVAQKEGRAPCTVKGQYIPSTQAGTTLGYYSLNDRTITINTEQLDSQSKYGNDYKTHLDTILHEGRHAYQHQTVLGEVEHDNKAEAAAWKNNLEPGHYISAERNPMGYYNQPVERDARGFAQTAMVGIENDKQLLKEKMAQEANKPKTLRRDPEELRKAGQKNIEDILDMRRDDLRDKGMKDGPEMEAIIQRERQALQAEFNKDAFGSSSNSTQNPSQNTYTYSERKSQFSGESSQGSQESNSSQEASGGNTSDTSKNAKKAMFAGNSSSNSTSNKNGGSSSSSKKNTITR